MSRLRFRVVLILLILILVVTAILFGLLTYWPDLPGPPSSNQGQGATGQAQQLPWTGAHGQVEHGRVDASSPFVAGRRGYFQKAV
jgi:uncharacterized SAM-binding protein YcdF (DUF218 family)